MKTIALFILSTLLLTSSFVTVPLTDKNMTFAASPDEPHLQSAFADMVSHIPLETLDGSIYYSDLSVMAARLPEELPGAFLSAYAATITLPHEFTAYMAQSTDGEVTSGVGVQHIDRLMTIYDGDGKPANRQTWLMGTFNQSRIRRALQARDYQLVEEGPHDPVRENMQIWAKDGDVHHGLQMDLATRNLSFLYGGMLGQSFPVLLSSDLIVYTPDGDDLLAAAKETELALAADPNMASLLQSIELVTPEMRGEIAQVVAGPPAVFELNASQQRSAASANQTEQYGKLPAYELFAQSHLYTDDHTYVVFNFIFQDEHDAEQAAEVMEQRVENLPSVVHGRSVDQQLEAFKGERLPIFIVDAAHRYVVVQSFQFPPENLEISAVLGRPYHMLFHWIQTRDTAWFTIDD